MAVSAKGKLDAYENIMTQQIDIAVADTLAFEELQVGLNLFDKVGMVLSRLEYIVPATVLALMTTAGDNITMALTNNNQMASLNSVDQHVIDAVTVHRSDMGTAATGVFWVNPLIHDFSTMHGGGLLVAPKPLFGAINTSGLGTATGVFFQLRLYMTLVSLTDADYLELLQTRGAFN